MSTPINRIVTRGFGMSRGLAGRVGPVTQGYGGPPKFIIESIRRSIRGQSGTKRRLQELQEIIVWAKLVELNRQPPPVDISGFVKVHTTEQIHKVIIEHVSSRVKRAWEGFKVIVRRIK